MNNNSSSEEKSNCDLGYHNCHICDEDFDEDDYVIIYLNDDSDNYCVHYCFHCCTKAKSIYYDYDRPKN